MANKINSIADLLKYVDPKDQEELTQLLTDGEPLWIPLVGPQLEAYNSPADVLFYGGSAGGG